MTEAESKLPPRESMDFDVVITGAGPAGLAAAIRLKQLSPELSVAVIEKGAELGAHILSGAVIDPCGLDKLLPDWRQDDDRPLTTRSQARPRSPHAKAMSKGSRYSPTRRATAFSSS